MLHAVFVHVLNPIKTKYGIVNFHLKNTAWKASTVTDV